MKKLLKKRLDNVKKELERAENFDYKVVNDDLETAIQNLENIIKGELKLC